MARQELISAVLIKFGKYVVQQARSNLTKGNHNFSKELYSSIKYNIYYSLFGEPANEYSAEAQFGHKWGWYSSFYHLAQGDVTRFESVGRLGVHQCLTLLTFDKEKGDVERKQLEKLKK